MWRGPAVILLTLAPVLLNAEAQAAPETEIFHVPSNGNLTRVLEDVQRYLRNGSGGYLKIELESGTFDLPGATDLATFVNVTEVAIVGHSRAETAVDCAGTTGFVFIDSSNLSIANVTFSNCASVQNSTSRNKSVETLSYIEFSAALYFLSCSDLHLENTEVGNSRAVGLAMFNVRGANTFSHCKFSENTYPPPEQGRGGYGGGGILLEFSYCSPGDIECGTNRSAVVEVANATFDFSTCFLWSNVANSSGLVNNITYPHGTEHVGFGRGGGLAIYFKGKATGNNVTLSNCVVEGNSAQWGGGLYIVFEDESQGNRVLITDTVIDTNGMACPGFNQRQYGGGGAQVQFVYYPPDEDLWPGYRANVTGNDVKFIRTYFSSNMGCWGGGVSFVSSRAHPYTIQSNSLNFSNCTFLDNQAPVAAALDISVQHPDTGQGQLISPTIDQCVVQNNTANTRTPDLIPDITGYQFGIGAVYIDEVPTTFTGPNVFRWNSGTGLVVSDAMVSVARNASLVLEQNSGKRGGALVMIGSACILTHPGVQLNFTGNTAREVGGAIYVETHFGEHDYLYEDSCFIRYYQYTVHPDRWDVAVRFSGNNATSDSSTIYITSLLACVWSGGQNLSDNINRTLCWKGWQYDGAEREDCSEYVKTAPAYFNNNGEYIYCMDVFPGHMKKMPIAMMDDYKQPVQTVIFQISSNNTTRARLGPRSEYVVDDSITVYGITNKSSFATFFVETVNPRVLSTTLHVTILPCPPGFHPQCENETSGMVRKCKCASATYFTCNLGELKAYVEPGYCITASKDTQHHNHSHTGSQTVGRCLATIGSSGPILLPNDSSRLDEDLCGQFKRTGQLCGQCVAGYGVAINNYIDCVRCKSASVSWLLYLLAEYLPITVFFIVVALFKISATSAPMNAFVFFAQITTLPYFHTQFPWIFGLSQESKPLQILVLFPYCIWNLDFFTRVEDGICLSPQVPGLYVLALGYLSAFYPMLLILLSYVCIQLHDRNFRPLVWVWKPFRACLIRLRHSWQPKTSIIDAFATFLMLSYTKLTIISFFFLTPAPLYTPDGNHTGETLFYFDPQFHYFRSHHLPLALVAIIVLITFVLIPPVFLFLYPLQVFQRCLNRSGHPCHTLHTFADAFQGCFKNRTNNNRDYRYFSGLYFVFRILILIVYIMELPPLTQLAIQQILCIFAILLFALVKPYKEAFYNKVDLLFFTLLAIMNTLSLCNYAHRLLKGSVSTGVFAVNYALALLPLIYIGAFLVYLFLKWRGCIVVTPKVKELETGVMSETNSEADNTSSTQGAYFEGGVPDRLINPQKYTPNFSRVRAGEEREGEREQGDVRASLLSEPKPQRWVSERSYFVKKARNLKNYSSQ